MPEINNAGRQFSTQWSSPLCGPGCRPGVRPGVEVCSSAGLIEFMSPYAVVSISGPSEVIKEVAEALGLDPSIIPEPLGERASRLSHLLNPLALQGMVVDKTIPLKPNGYSGLNLVGDVLERIHECSAQIFSNNTVLAGLADGTEPLEVAKGWLMESYFYTSMAEWHIGPVLEHPLKLEERIHWKSLFEEERNHYRIYRKVFRELKWNSDARHWMKPMDETLEFVSSLRCRAQMSSSAYAGVILFIEQPLVAEALHNDPLFGSLCKNYGFSHASIHPLFEHSVANGNNGHSDLGAHVLAKRPWFSAEEAEGIIEGVGSLAQALDRWYQALGRNYREPAFHVSRFREIATRRPLEPAFDGRPFQERTCT